jgi:peptidoglycan hydrolase-like protein with peptidoglycan-binding domain
MRIRMRRTVTGALGVALAVGTAGATTGAASAGAATATQTGSATAAHLSWPTVKIGDKGNRVFAIQYLLRVRGYAVGPSGVFGGITRHDVAHFQRVRGMKGTGAVMRGTWERLIIAVAFGSRGNAVAGVQQNLHSGYGYKNLPVTGFFGRITRADVRDFQRKHHIGVDGIVGPVTWNTIISNEI